MENPVVSTKIQLFKTIAYWHALCISYMEHTTNKNFFKLAGMERTLWPQVISQKLKYFWHTMRHPGLDQRLILGQMHGLWRLGGQKKL